MALVEQELSTLGDTIPWFRGKRRVAEHTKVPRYVWYRITDRPDRPRTVNKNPGERISFDETVSVHIWAPGDTYEQAERYAYTMRDNLLSVLWDHHRGRFTILESGPVEPESPSWQNFGFVYVLNFSLSIPADDGYVNPADGGLPQGYDTATVTAVEHEGILDLPSGDETACNPASDA